MGAILPALPKGYALSVLIVQHLHPSDEGSFANHLARRTQLPVNEAHDKERIERGRIYAAPANYHMLVERDGTISLSVDEKVNWSRPSIDVLFDSAARVWGEALIAVLLSGANADGAEGMRVVKAAGGLTIAQDPATAESPVMPRAAIETGTADEVLAPEAIAKRLVEFG